MNPGGERGHNTSELGHLNNPTDLIFFFGGKVHEKKKLVGFFPDERYFPVKPVNS